MQFKCWVMFDNHTFWKVSGSLEEIKENLHELYETTFEFPDGRQRLGETIISGWGRLSIEPSQGKEWSVLPGLNKRSDIERLLDPDHVKLEIEKEKLKISELLNETCKHETDLLAAMKELNSAQTLSTESP